MTFNYLGLITWHNAARQDVAEMFCSSLCVLWGNSIPNHGCWQHKAWGLEPPGRYVDRHTNKLYNMVTNLFSCCLLVPLHSGQSYAGRLGNQCPEPACSRYLLSCENTCSEAPWLQALRVQGRRALGPKATKQWSPKRCSWCWAKQA